MTEARGNDGPSSRADIVAAALAQGDQDKAQAKFALMFPHSIARGPLSVAPVTSLDAACQPTTILPAREIIIPATRFDGEYRYTAAAARFGTITGGGVVSGWDFAFKADAVIGDLGYLAVGDIQALWPHLPLPRPERVIFYGAPPAQVAGDVAFLSYPIQGHVGHWMIDFLPRLRAREFCRAPFVVPAEIGPRQLELLSLFGIGEPDLIRVKTGAAIRFERLHIYAPGCAMPPVPEHVAFTRDRLFAGSKVKPGKRIFLSRHSVKSRMVANHAEFAQFLDDHGFISADMADLSIAQQQELLGDAEVLLGVHGTNLLALYHAPPGAKLIVLWSGDEPVVAHTCHFLGIDHRPLACTWANASGDRKLRHKKDMDLLVDIPALRDLMFA